MQSYWYMSWLPYVKDIAGIVSVMGLSALAIYFMKREMDKNDKRFEKLEGADKLREQKYTEYATNIQSTATQFAREASDFKKTNLDYLRKFQDDVIKIKTDVLETEAIVDRTRRKTEELEKLVIDTKTQVQSMNEHLVKHETHIKQMAGILKSQDTKLKVVQADQEVTKSEIRKINEDLIIIGDRRKKKE